jgi:hypothetical protein
MLTYLTSKGLTDAQIQLISGHESKKSLEVYQHLSLESVDKAYQDAVQGRGDLRRFLWDFTYLCWANPSLRRILDSNGNELWRNRVESSGVFGLWAGQMGMASAGRGTGAWIYV